MLINYESAVRVAAQALENVGVPVQAARTQVSLLVEGELRGRASHGLLRLPRIIERIRNKVADPIATGKHLWRGTSYLDVDGQNGLGPVVALAALDAAMERTRDAGAVIVGIHNNNHLGMLAWYAEHIARQGYVLIAMSTSEALVHPWGGRSAMLGTNPISVGVPTSDRPFVLDMATSVISMGKIHDYAQLGKPLEPGWALDTHGNPTTDAMSAKNGSIAPFGQAKGYALGLAIEVLVTSLTASAIGTEVQGTLDSTEVCNKGDVFVVVKPGQSNVAAKISAYLDLIRASGSEDGVQVLVPGDRATAMRNRMIAQGIDLPPALWDRLRTDAEQK
ncbi:Ldh family oxidoreductase [Allopusillimonas ginsengisoli]|uniref:Ldh family oxidoreductase n=1 Tax=Allopusillimonas ginsengisoli TaxID=453575 RepID=UPI0010C177E7|nr:Ldh family oxidoreductase [Allopusillimonas ginsengisoli]